MVDGEKSELVKVDSGVPQRAVIGPLIFFFHINNLSDIVKSVTNLFSDECLDYKVIRTMEDQIALQKDLDDIVE